MNKLTNDNAANITHCGHLPLFWLAAGAAQAKIKTNAGCEFSSVTSGEKQTIN